MFLLQAPPGAGYSQFILIGGMILVFWLFFIRPQAKRQKLQKTFISDLQPGDQVVTIAGIHGRISRLNEDGTTFELEVARGYTMRMERSSISMEMTQALKKGVTPAVADKK
ncbi:preprotein translocase subunit YajC [Flaviaesturariibacter amylovorans]|uniref:Sec translocon accessory complex subunit YajC n=1 Tax=Flaviaesturariibacter amylovorans TaxID=1084520 RepID=A0ABP8GNS7_9BACT